MRKGGAFVCSVYPKCIHINIDIDSHSLESGVYSMCICFCGCVHIKKNPIFSTWMTDSRPGNKTPRVKFCVESDFQVENTQLLEPEGKNKENRN